MNLLRLSLPFVWLLYIAFAFHSSAQTVSGLAGVPVVRLGSLHHGVNISGWFAQIADPKGYTEEHFKTWVSDDDLTQIRNLGFYHVRVGVDPKPLFVSKQAEQIPPDKLKFLDDAVDRIVQHGLAVILTLQPDDDFQKEVVKDDDSVEQFADFWRGLAGHFSCRDGHAGCVARPDVVYFEVLNEPNLSDAYRWSGIQAKLIAAIRESAHDYTIVATGAQRSAIDGLLFMEPVFDRNVVYSFHYYEPFVFTHQGANWSTNYLHRVAQLSYPSSPASANAAAKEIPDALNTLYVTRYGLENWNKDRIASDIAQVKKWANARGVSVICDEFGVNNKAPSNDRNLWIRDVRTALEPDIGWTVWDYAGNFGVAKRNNQGKAEPDDGVLKALGLR